MNRLIRKTVLAFVATAIVTIGWSVVAATTDVEPVRISDMVQTFCIVLGVELLIG